MAEYIKHNSNYIKTVRHQFLKDGSTIYERDWVTVGSQLNFGPGKIPYYNDGNFIFTTSPTPFYQKKYKNGVLVGVWTYEDVKDASNVVNKINLDEHTEDIRSYVYYGSCLELVRVSIENIIKWFPGNITISDEELGVYKDTQTCACEEGEETYVSLNENEFYTLKNPFNINIYLKDVQLTEYDNPLRYLTQSFKKYQISTNGSFVDIDSYKVVMRQMYEKVSPPCIIYRKQYVTTVTVNVNETRQNVSLGAGDYFIILNRKKLTNWKDLCKHDGDAAAFTLGEETTFNIRNEGGEVVFFTKDGETEQSFYNYSVNSSATIEFYVERESTITYKSYQMFDDVEYGDDGGYKDDGWVKSTCYMKFWLPKTGETPQTNAETDFLNECENKRVRYSYLDEGHDKNQAVYTVTINDDIEINGYIYNGEVIPLVEKYDQLVIQPKEEVIEEYFNNLEGFEKQLLTRKTKPLYLNRFVTPIEYNLGYLYYKRTYTWPSEGYCIDITSPRYIDFVTSLSNMAQLFDELWTDNLWRRMTHEAIKNYDWTYTREFEEGEEQDNVDGGERMHKVLNIIARVFDDIKRTIDVVKRNSRVTYDADRNVPNALLSDKLELRGWDIYSTIPSYEDTEEVEEDGVTNEITKTVYASEQTITEDFLEKPFIDNEIYEEKWYPTLNPSRMTFADVDNQFMRKLLLSTRRIFETKGTRHGIDMIMGMFGYGNMNEDYPDYEITEEYYITIPRKYDEEVGVDEFGDTEYLGDRIVRLNTMSKEIQLLYDEDASGIPVDSFAIFKKNQETGKQEPTTYLIPFYNQNKIYDGDLYFQARGGWFYKGDYTTEPDPFKWTETLSYLHVASRIKDLLNVNPNSVENGDIFYIDNINDYIEYTEEPLYSHFFVLEDDYNPEKFSSWTNLNLEDGFYDSEESAMYTQEESDKYEFYVKKAKYLDSIIPYVVGNNPHVGYGKYDMGNEYLEYMKQPFKYSIDNENFDTVQHRAEAQEITFELDREDTGKDGKEKIQIIENGFNTEEFEYYGGLSNLKYQEYDLDAIKDLEETQYFINSKVIRFTNTIQGSNDNYKSYFRNVIMKYLMQLIPSTTIFVLENFELDSEKQEEGGGIRVHFLNFDGSKLCSIMVTEEECIDPCMKDSEHPYVWLDEDGGKPNFDDCIKVTEETTYILEAKTVIYYDTDRTTPLHTEHIRTNGKTKHNPCGKWININTDEIIVGCNPQEGDKTWPQYVTDNLEFAKIETEKCIVIFYRSDREHEIARFEAEVGQNIESPIVGAKWYNYEDVNKEELAEDYFPYTITEEDCEKSPLKFVQLVYWTIQFVDIDGTQMDKYTIKDGDVIHDSTEYPDLEWYRNGDENRTKIVFDDNLIAEKDEIFVRWTEVTHIVEWVDNGDVVHTVEWVDNGEIYHDSHIVEWVDNGEIYQEEKITVQWVDENEFIPVDKNIRVTFTVEGEQQQTETQAVAYGDPITPPEGFESYQWYLKHSDDDNPVEFPFIVIGDVEFTTENDDTQDTHTVEWVDDGDILSHTVEWVDNGDTLHTVEWVDDGETLQDQSQSRPHINEYYSVNWYEDEEDIGEVSLYFSISDTDETDIPNTNFSVQVGETISPEDPRIPRNDDSTTYEWYVFNGSSYRPFNEEITVTDDTYFVLDVTEHTVEWVDDGETYTEEEEQPEEPQTHTVEWVDNGETLHTVEWVDDGETDTE